jgi:ABC-type multidrug transport system fused ATPase/permease subunit
MSSSEKKMSTIQVLQKALGLLTKRDRSLLAGVVIIQLFLGVIDLVAVGIIGLIGSLAVRGVSATAPGSRISRVLELIHLDAEPLQRQATILGVAAALLMCGKTLFSIWFNRRSLFFIGRRSAIASGELISKVLKQNLEQLQSRSFQTTLYGVTTGIDLLSLGVIGTMVLMISDVTLAAIMIIGLFVVDAVVAISTLIFFAGVALILHKMLATRTQALARKSSVLAIQNNQRILEVLGAFREISTKNRKQFYAQEISRTRMRLAEYNAEKSFMPSISKYVFELTTIVGAFTISAIQFVLNDAAHAVAILVVFLAASARISPALLRIQQGTISIKSSATSAKPTLELLEELGVNELSNPLREVSRDKVTKIDFVPTINIQNLTYQYPNSEIPAIDNLNLEIANGEIVALVGTSGAGKSTLVDVILGLLEPKFGNVLIGELPPKLALATYSGQIAYVPQDALIFEGTVRENVTIGFDSDHFSDEEVWNALEIASLGEFVKESNRGLDLQVGERGTKLSGGQRQRLGIARAVVTNPKLLVLDEATSALDGQTELSISESIQKLQGSCTIILIAHRLSTVRKADKIIYLESGKVRAIGNFDELRAQVSDFDTQARLMGL